MLGVISGVGSFYHVGATNGLKTLPVTPSAIGDCFIFGCTLGSGTLTAISGGGVTTWTKLVGPFSPTGYSAASTQLWLGPITATGSQTITITGTLTSTNRLVAKQFTAGGGANTVWLADGSGGTKETDSTASANTPFATLVPSAPQRLYVGYGPVGTTATTSGQTSGYTVQTDDGTNPYIWNPNVTTSQSPNVIQASAGHSTNVSALIYALVPPYGAFMPLFM